MTGKPFELAKKAARAAAPEITIPLAAARRLAARAPSPRGAPPPSGPVEVIQPPERQPLFTWGKERVRVITRKGVRIVTVQRPHSVTAGEAIVVGVLALGGYELAKNGLTNPFSAQSRGQAAVGTINAITDPLGLHKIFGFG